MDRERAEKMMALALREGRKSRGRTSPNPMVGAVVADGERVIAAGRHLRAGADHAEVEALEKAGSEARGADLYVTLEPCNHQGRTPPCTRAVIEAGVARVFIGQDDPNPNVTGGGGDFLASRGIEVHRGILREKCEELNEYYTKHVTTGRPYVLIKSAATLDGKIASTTGHSKWVTGEKARRYVHRLRDGVDAILVGRETVVKDNPLLSTRLPGGKKGRDPVRVVLDTWLDLPLSARIFSPDEGGATIAACGRDAPAVKAEALEEHGVKVWRLPLHHDRVSLDALAERLGRENILSLLIEGGSEVNAAALLDEKIVDKVLFFYAPKIVGGRGAATLAGGRGLESMEDALPVEIVRVRRLGPDLLVEARPVY